jgi:hypothetical protein
MIPVASCFSQLISLVNRTVFARAVRQHQAERGAKGFNCWDQFVAMLFCQYFQAEELADLIARDWRNFNPRPDKEQEPS